MTPPRLYLRLSAARRALLWAIAPDLMMEHARLKAAIAIMRDRLAWIVTSPANPVITDGAQRALQEAYDVLCGARPAT